MSRKLARIVLIDDVFPHPNADRMDIAMIGGWQCCVAKGSIEKGQKALYCEIDSLIPVDEEGFEFLAARTSDLKTVEDRKYSRIRAIKLRGELSCGLIVPVPNSVKSASVDEDVSAKLGIIKFEKREAGVSVGSINKKKLSKIERLAYKIAPKYGGEFLPFPSNIPKSDQERVQNRSTAYALAVKEGELFEKSYKLDGSSFTAFLNNNEDHSVDIGVCSRNNRLRCLPIKFSLVDSIRLYASDFLLHNKRFGVRNWKIRLPKFRCEISPAENDFVKMFQELNLEEKLFGWSKRNYGTPIAIQGELVGPKIQRNFEGVQKNELYIYSVYLNGIEVLPHIARRIVIEELELNYVPVFEEYGTLKPTIAECLQEAEGPKKGSSGLNGAYREGFVYKSTTRNFSFKAISARYLLNEPEEEEVEEDAVAL